MSHLKLLKSPCFHVVMIVWTSAGHFDNAYNPKCPELLQCDWLFMSRLMERTQAGIKLNSSLFTTPSELCTKWEEWSGTPGIHGQSGGKVLHTRSLIHAPLIPISAHLLRSCDPIRSALTRHATLPNTHAQESGMRVTRRVQEIYVQTNEGWSETWKH